MAGIILPGQVPRKQCICGEKFFSKRLYIQHVSKCSTADEMVQEAEAQRQSNVFTSVADKEAREWISKRLSEGKPATKGGRPA